MNEIDILQESEYLDIGNEFLDLYHIRRSLNVLKSFHLDEKSKIKNIKIQFNNSTANLYFNLFQNFKTSVSKRIIETFFANNTKNIWIIKIDINLDKQTYDALEAYSFLEDMDWFYKINIVVQLKLLQVFDKLNLHETCKFILSTIEFANDKNLKNEDFANLMLDIFKVTNFKDENNLCNNNVIGLIKKVITLIANNTYKNLELLKNKIENLPQIEQKQEFDKKLKAVDSALARKNYYLSYIKMRNKYKWSSMLKHFSISRLFFFLILLIAIWIYNNTDNFLIKNSKNAYEKYEKDLNKCNLAVQSLKKETDYLFDNLDIETKDANQIFLHSVEKGYKEITYKILNKKLNYPINVNQKDKEGRTPLHLAVKSKKTDIFKLLKNYGADESIRDKYGKTPLDYSDLDFRSNLSSS